MTTPFHYLMIIISHGQPEMSAHARVLTSCTENSYVALIDANTLQITFSIEAN